MRALAHWSNVGTFAENSSCRIALAWSKQTHVAQIFQFGKMTSTTVPPAPMTGGGGAAGAGGTSGASGTSGATSAASAKPKPDNTLLTLIQFYFIRHPRISDLHRSLNDIYGFTIDDEADINTLFVTPERVDIKGDVESLRAARRLLIENAMCQCTKSLLCFS